MRGAHLFAATAALLAGLSGAAPARAAHTPVTMTLAIAPDEVRQGSRIVLAGRAGFGDSGNAAPVDLYFRKSQADPFVRAGTATATSSGRFRATLTARASGDYQAVYRGNERRGAASAGDYVAVFTTSTTEQTVYRWSGTGLRCRPDCRATGPDQRIVPGPVRISFERLCTDVKSAGSIGFTADPKNVHTPGAPGWRSVTGTGRTELELTPPVTDGHFHLRWSSQGSCDISFTAAQRVEEKRYV